MKVDETKEQLICENVSFSWDSRLGQAQPALTNISFKVEKGEFVSILGPSGCGKTTLLYLLSGLKRPYAGKILLNGQIIQGPTQLVGIVFQEHNLFPWLTVQKNIEFGMKMLAFDQDARSDRSEEILRKVGLWNKRHRFPRELSGGMKQRVAIARVLAYESPFILMDEPFASLDYQTRLKMQEFLLEMWEEFHRTIIFVTHQVDEALHLSDQILLMSSGPGQISEKHHIDVSRPRDLMSDKLNKLRGYVFSHLKREVDLKFESELEE